MKISDKGLLEIAEHEGIVPAPYRDSNGVWTFGIGHTAAAGGLDPQEMNGAMPTGTALDAAIDRALSIFRDDLVKYEARVNQAIRVPLKQHEFDALVSFDFNTGGILVARLTSAINSGNRDAYRHFMGWLQPPEIRGRRTDEMNLFRNGDYNANGDRIPVWRTDGKGSLNGQTSSMSGAELLSRMHPASAQQPGWLAAIINAILALFGKGK